MITITPAPEPRSIKFPQSNFCYRAPAGMANCVDLHVFKAPGTAGSCWQFSFRDRLKFLITGKMWLWMVADYHPPVRLSVVDEFAEADKAAK